MPITVEVPELGRSVEFPDDMSHEDIASAITQHLGSIAEAGFEKAVGVSQKAASMFGVGRMAQESMLRAEAKTELQRQQREAQVAGDIAASEAASAGVGEQVAEFARTFPQRAIKAPFELAQAAGVPIGKPTLSPDEIAYLRSRYAAMESPLTPPQPAGPKEQAITDWLNEQASGLTSPEMVGAVGAPVAAKLAKMSPEAIGAAGRLIARGFQAQMASGVPEAVQQTVEAPDVPSAIKGGLSTAAAVGLPLAIEAGLTKPLPKIPDYPGLRFRSERGVPTALGNEELQAESAKQAAMLDLGRKAKVQALRPAVKTMEGEVVAGEKGQSHNDIIEQNKIPATDVDKREFVDQQTGQELSREQVAAAIPTEKPGEAHSSDLTKAQDVAPPPEPAAAPNPLELVNKPPRVVAKQGEYEIQERFIQADDNDPSKGTVPLYEAFFKGSKVGSFDTKDEAISWAFKEGMEDIAYEEEKTRKRVSTTPTPPPEPAVAPKAETVTPPTPAPKAEPSGATPEPPTPPAAEPPVAKVQAEVQKTSGGEIKSLIKANVKADPRLEEPGITKASKPNSLVVQLRDLESFPVREIVLSSSGDPMTDAKAVETIIKENAHGSVSLRESMAVTTGPNGRAILKFGMSPSGMTWANADKFVATREFAKASRDLADARLTYIIGEPREKFANAPKSKLKIMQAYWKAKDALTATEESPTLPPPAEQKPQPPADVGPGMVGMGGALTGEVETGHGADIYGIAERVRAERAKAGQVAAVEPGKGISAQESVEHGRELLDAGANAEQVLSNFEKTKQLSSEDMAVVRAQGERLAQDARRIEEQFGTTSQQYLDAWKRLSDWDARSKAMQTEWHRTGQAQQGETDIDTGTFTGLQRAHKEVTGKDFTPQQAKKAKVVADRSAKATAEADKAKADLNTELAKEPPVPPRVKALSERLISTLDKSAESALARIKKRRAEGRLFIGIPVEEMADYAIYGASKITKGLVEFGKWSEEMVKDIGDFIKPHLKDIWEAADKRLDFEIKRLAPGPAGQLVKESVTTGTGGMSAAERRAFNAEKKTVRENAVRIANLENKARQAEVERNNAIDAIEAASKARGEKTGVKQTREEAIRTAKGASKARLLKAERDKATADAQLKAARDAQAQSQARAREYAAKVAQTERRLQGNPMKRVWNRANIYLEKGLDNFDEIRNKVATDLGMTVNQVTRLMAQSPRIKQLANDLWRKQQNARRLKEQAKRWVWSLSTPGYVRALQMVPRAMFGLKVGFHGTVALGTHAPMVAFQPRFWATYVRDFGKMYGMVGSKAYYERQVQDLMRRPNYITARRAGLVNDPFVYEDYNSPDTAKYFGNLTGMGNRGYTVLKIIRQDMFDQMWEKLPKTAQIPEVAQAIADGLNHATGVVKGRAPRGTNVALFAPRLEASRVMWLAVDPAKMLGTFLNWKNASTGDRMFAMNQLKEKAWVFGTLAGMLALNQGFLTATGSKQKINGVPKALGGHGIDPMESDFLKFKAAGLDVAYGSAMLNMAKLPARMATSIMFHGKTSKLILEDERVYKIAGDYIRSQLSPFAGTATDLALGRDYMGRPLPRALFGTIEGPKDIPKRLRLHGVTKPYTWPEYSSIQFTPIPISEGIHEVWGQGLGMSDAQIDHYLKAWAIISIMAGTGARVTEDYQLKK